MLFVQEITLVYTKEVRGGDYAAARKAMRFLPVEFDKAEITDEILFNKAELFQSPKGIAEQRNRTRILGENALFTGKFAAEFFGERIYVKRAENGYEILYTDKKQRGYIKSKFTLTDGKSGRIVYNDRRAFSDCSMWYYYSVTFNFVCADRADFKPKIFFRKETDFVFTDMKKLRYSGF
ncbi:MAG: hypothetical protein NC299_12545 [Lachnospiraceae bacterium]|nr:hypothetical protein [Ruminococcus sp.]MCM1276169.1 hypothetical protein [Lachnospiraceae bacterium]